LIVRTEKVPVQQAVQQAGFPAPRGPRQTVRGNGASLVTIPQAEALLQQLPPGEIGRLPRRPSGSSHGNDGSGAPGSFDETLGQIRRNIAPRRAPENRRRPLPESPPPRDTHDAVQSRRP
jgi:hypothetical protein